MSSKKKPRPLFEVPVDIETSRESGWVYRSNGSVEEHVTEIGGGGGGPTGGSVIDSGSLALALGIAAIAQTLVLGLTIAAIPLTLGIRSLQRIGREHRL